MPTCCGEPTRSNDQTFLQSTKRVIRHKTTTTALYLYGAHFLNYLVPALNVAILTRRFTPACYGRLLIAQSLGYTVGTFTEYGFQWTGARAVAERADTKSLGSLVSSIAAAKLLIACTCAILIPLYMLSIRSISGDLWLVLSGYAWGALQGNDLQWYFLGREQLRGYLSVDSLMRILAVALILIFVRNDHDVYKVLTIQSLCTLGLLTWAIRRVTSEVKIVKPTKNGIRAVMHDGGTLFLQRLAGYASGAANVAVLGIVASPAEVGFFGAADKLGRYFSSLAVPVTQIVYPKLSKAVGSPQEQATKRLAVIAGGISLGMAGLASLALFTMPRLIILTLYGVKMLPALPALQVIAFFPLLNSLTTSMLFYWLLPNRKERLSLRVMVLAGILNLIGVAVFGRLWKQLGAASAVVLTESITVIGYLTALRITNRRSVAPDTAVLPKMAS